MAPDRRRRTEDGTALIEFVWLTVLLLVPLLYIVLAVFDVQRAAFAASTAARSASRAFITSPDRVSAQHRARTAARLAFEDQGVESDFALHLECRPTPHSCHAAGSSVIVEVRARAVLPLMPPIFGGHPPAVSVDASHRSPYGAFRADLP